MDIDQDLVKIIFSELGKNGADLFGEFYSGSPLKEQVEGARSILTIVIGNTRTETLLKKFTIET